MKIKPLLISIIFGASVGFCSETKVRIAGDSIKIFLENKDSLKLVNNHSGGEASVEYSYDGFVAGINFHKICIKGYEYQGYELINNKNGKKISFEGEPKVFQILDSKKEAYYVAVMYVGYALPKIDIYELKDSEIVHANQSEALSGNRCWSFGKMFCSNHGILIQRIFRNPKNDGGYEKAIDESIVLEDGKWVLKEKVHLKENCEVDSAKTEQKYLGLWN